MDRIIKISCKESDLILDPFCGSGSMGIAACINKCKYIGIDKSKEAIDLCNKRKLDYHISQSAVIDGKYDNFNNLDNEIKKVLLSINAIPIERNKGLDGICSSPDGLIGIRFQRNNESISEAISLMRESSEEKPIEKKILVKTHDSDLFEIIPDDILIIESFSYTIMKILSHSVNNIVETELACNNVAL
jgi:site-specific DNA-methyltransferase (adenine-specific)